MTTTELNSIYHLARILPPQHWAPAFAGKLVRLQVGREEAYRTASRLLDSQFAYGNLDWLHDGITSVDLPATAGTLTEENWPLEWGTSRYYLPSKVLCTAPLPLRLPSLCRVALGLPETISDSLREIPILKQISTCIEKFLKYRHRTLISANRNATKQISCAVLPYHDCLLIPALLFLVSDSKSFEMRYQFKYWLEMIESIASHESVDLGYISEDQLSSHAQFKFTQIKVKPTDLVGLKFGAHSAHTPGTSKPLAINFQGYYARESARAVIELQTHEAGNLFFDVDPRAIWSEALDLEHHLIASCAYGLLPREILIVPSLQGYVWAAEAGLLLNEQLAGSCQTGSLSSHPVSISRRSGEFGYFVRHNGSPDGRAAASALSIALNKGQTWLRDLLKSRLGLVAQASIEESRAQLLMSVLLAPLFAARDDYHGILTMLEASTILDVILRWSEEEDELRYKPSWWIILERHEAQHKLGLEKDIRLGL